MLLGFVMIVVRQQQVTWKPFDIEVVQTNKQTELRYEGNRAFERLPKLIGHELTLGQLSTSRVASSARRSVIETVLAQFQHLLEGIGAPAAALPVPLLPARPYWSGAAANDRANSAVNRDRDNGESVT